MLLLRTEASLAIANWLLLPVGKAEKPRIAAILPNLSEACGAPVIAALWRWIFWISSLGRNGQAAPFVLIMPMC